MEATNQSSDIKHDPSSSASHGGIRLRGVEKSFQRGSEIVPILKGVDLDIPPGSFEALMGPSGSGKSTLLNIIAGLDKPTAGAVDVGGRRVDQMSESALGRWRANTVGFVFQAFNLLSVLTAAENVELPLVLAKLRKSERRRRAETALRIVGLEERMTHYPKQLSGGQEQRVAIARAIVNDPVIIVADEPTGNLDRKNTEEVLLLLEKLNRELGKTILIVTHDPTAAERANVIRRLEKGTLV
jgi:putative ABC transport system ATP-binding protein